MTAPVALTMGDPAGIGPEIALKAWRALRGRLPFAVIGDLAALTGSRAEPDVPVRAVDRIEDAAAVFPDALPVIDLPAPAPVVPGTPDRANAASVIAWIDRAVALTRTGQAVAVCTNPISKQVLIEGAGFAYPGHTEYLAHLGGVARSVMMLASPLLKVVPVTIHIPLADVPRALDPALIEDTLRIVQASLKSDFGLEAPRIAVAGLNPHAGEGGLMGTEEQRLIAPVLDRLRNEGMILLGPLPADTMFHAAARARYDAAVCMYHDQALIPIKALDFDRGVNVTLGLPFVRTSPDHGTAFDIAGRGLADPSSLIAALELAATMGARRVAAR